MELTTGMHNTLWPIWEKTKLILSNFFCLEEEKVDDTWYQLASSCQAFSVKKTLKENSAKINWQNFNKNVNNTSFIFIITYEWNSTLFEFSSYMEGTNEKVLQFKMPFKSIYNKNLGFVEQKNIFEHYREVSNSKKSVNWHDSWHEKIFLVTFSELPPIGFC